MGIGREQRRWQPRPPFPLRGHLTEERSRCEATCTRCYSEQDGHLGSALGDCRPIARAREAADLASALGVRAGDLCAFIPGRRTDGPWIPLQGGETAALPAMREIGIRV